MKERVAIIDGVRTPMGKAGGLLRGQQADDLGARVLSEILAKTAIKPNQIDEVIFGCVSQPTHAANIARVIALKASVPIAVPAYTVHRNCASGMEAISSAANSILLGRSQIIAAGGAESMSNIPLLMSYGMTKFFMNLMKSKTVGQKLAAVTKFRPSFLRPIIAVELGLTDPVCGLNMGHTAEILAKEFGITRRDQDTFALISHRRASKASNEKIFEQEITPICSDHLCSAMISKDEGPRDNQTIEALAKLKPYFDPISGTVTVGNACPLTDGAAAVILMSEAKAREMGLAPLGYLREYAYAGLEPDRMGLGPVFATSKALSLAGMTMKDIELIELNEAFAAQVIANEIAFASNEFATKNLGINKALGEIDRTILNVNGGAIALGHPVGMTGTRIVIHLLKQMKRMNKHRGLATLCIGGGQGAAMILERDDGCN